MIGEYTLEMLCNKYNLSKDKLIKKNRNILDYGEYKEIDETLNYLINKLRIQPENIEKCPSILYRNVNQIVNNINFLKEQKINFSEIESCLHVLSTEYKRLIETYNYVESNYGLQAINKNTSILSCPIKIILSVENLNLNRDFNLTICVSIGFGKTTLEEIQKIIQSKEYQEHPDLFTSTTLAHAKLEDVQKLLSMDCWNDERYRRLLTSSVVAKSKSIISKLPILFDIAEEYGLTDYLNTSFMLVSPNKNYALIKYLEENNLKLIIDGKLNPVFGKTEGLLKKKYNIDIGKYMKKYSLEEFKFGGKRL